MRQVLATVLKASPMGILEAVVGHLDQNGRGRRAGIASRFSLPRVRTIDHHHARPFLGLDWRAFGPSSRIRPAELGRALVEENSRRQRRAAGSNIGTGNLQPGRFVAGRGRTGSVPLRGAARMRVGWALALLGMVVLPACEPDPSSPVEVHEDAEADLGLVGFSYADVWAPTGSIDAYFLRINREVPGFSGLVIEAGKPTILATDEGALPAAEQALRSFFEARGITDATGRRLVEHEWQELARWHRSLLGLLGSHRVVRTTISARKNQVMLGVLPGYDDELLMNIVAERGIPDEAVRLELTAPVRTSRDADASAARSNPDLDDRVRPTIGGLRVFPCTLGFNIEGGSSGMRFATNSHCTQTFGGVDGVVFHQPDDNAPGNRVGVETSDAPFFGSGHPDCPDSINGHEVGDECRWSDAALISYDDSVDVSKGYIARTESSGQSSGSLTIVGDFAIVGTRPDSLVIEGDTLHKVGATTGWTEGTVNQTCANEFIQDEFGPRVLLCQRWVSAGGDDGDSGSPVFAQVEENQAELAGIFWGFKDPGPEFVYSPINMVKKDYPTITFDVQAESPPPPLTASIVGADQVPPQTSCTWQAIVDDGEEPYGFEWSGVLSGTNSWVNGVVSESGWLYLDVESDDLQQASDSLFVEVTSEAGPCPEVG